MIPKVYYPIFLDLQGRPVLVAGAGKVALRKTRGLVEAGARVTVVAPEILPEFARLPVTLLRRSIQDSDLSGMTLIFTATGDRQTNRKVAEEARRLGIPVNVADAARECDFLVPARLRHRDLQIAISTGGVDPQQAAEMRRKLEAFLTTER